MNSIDDVWSAVVGLLGDALSPIAISTWFSDCRAVALRDNCLVLWTPSDFKKNILDTRFRPAIKDALKQLFATDTDVSIISGDAIREYEGEPDQPTRASDWDYFTFERFIVGASNKFAHAAAVAVAEEQTNTYNPLFIYGESGLGKTHLLCAIRNVIRKKHPDWKIVFVKGDDFMNELIMAIQTGKNIAFREKYRGADLFLMDDVQFIAGKEATQDEFFHTFNTLYESGKQIVFTSDRPPNEILRLADRLRTRFESGLIADIQPPDYETRVAIINNKAEQLGLSLGPDVITYIAENMTSNVRQIEGAVKKITAVHDLMGTEISVATVEQIIRDMFKEEAESITPELIIDETAKFYSIPAEEIKSQRRTKNTALARQISMYLIRKLTTLTLKDIGEFYEGRDHTTVLSSIRRIEDLVSESSEFSQTIKDITANINKKT